MKLNRRLLIFALAAVAAGLATRQITAQQGPFTSPDKEGRARAIGDTRSLPELEKKAFSESPLFREKMTPGRIDWLANHPERGQTFDQFLRTRRNPFRAPRTILYLQPIGPFPPDAATVLNQVKEYAELFFQAKVVMQKPLDPGEFKITARNHPQTKQHQLLSTDILALLRKDLPEDAYARLGVTMTDLYPDPKWNFVFGQASLRERTGVYSFARYGDPGSPEFLRRCSQVLTHEAAHMFGMFHCVHFQCLLNGSNHLGESDATPLQLCPVCLRKLHSAIPFDLRKRYRDLRAFFEKAKLDDDAGWMRRRVDELGG